MLCLSNILSGCVSFLSGSKKIVVFDRKIVFFLKSVLILDIILNPGKYNCASFEICPRFERRLCSEQDVALRFRIFLVSVNFLVFFLNIF